MKNNRIYHFHPKDTCKGGVTVVYDPSHNMFAIARCSSLDHFNRRAGVAICETRLKTARAAIDGQPPGQSFQNQIVCADSLGNATDYPVIATSTKPSNDGISALAFLLAEAVAMKSDDTSLVQYLAKSRPQIDEYVEYRFREGLESIGWDKYCAELIT